MFSCRFLNLNWFVTRFSNRQGLKNPVRHRQGLQVDRGIAIESETVAQAKRRQRVEREA